MKITIVSHLFPTQENPAQGKFIKDHWDFLQEEDRVEDTSLLIPTPYAPPFSDKAAFNKQSLLDTTGKASRFNYLSFPRKKYPRISQFSLAKQLQKEIYSHNTDLIHFHFLYSSGIAIPKISSKGHKTVLSIHGGDFYRTVETPGFEKIIPEIFNAVDKLLLVGPQLYHDILEKFPSISEKTHQINNLIDESFYSLVKQEDKVPIRQRLNLPDSKVLFLTVANNRPEKGVDILLDSVRKLEDLNDKIHFVIVGNMSDSFKEKEIEPHPMVSILDPMPPNKLLELYHASDVYVSPSRKEGFGLALVEAATCGLPVIANPTGIATSLIEQSNGILNDDFQSKTMEKSIKEIIQQLNTFDPAKIRDTVVGTFGKEVFIKKLLSIYEDVIQS